MEEIESCDVPGIKINFAEGASSAPFLVACAFTTRIDAYGPSKLQGIRETFNNALELRTAVLITKLSKDNGRTEKNKQTARTGNEHEKATSPSDGEGTQNPKSKDRERN
jgi:hypothetical protein